MKLLNDLKKAFIAHYFYQIKNGKFLVFEGAFVYMIFACMVLSYGVIYHFNSFGLIPFLIPFALGFYMFIKDIKIDEDSSKFRRYLARKINPYIINKINDINELAPHWRTQLRALTDPRLGHLFNSQYDLWLEEHLDNKWLETYGERFEDRQEVKLNKCLPIALPVLCVIVILLYA
jgi:hypothetical protein